jgi:TRAP-type mannitol/chloroaromatic compound transport system permease large subunit
MMVGLALFGIFLILLGIGLSVSFSMSASTLVALIMADYTPQMFPLMLEEGVRSFLLLSVPFFILAGNLMNSTGVTQRIFDFSSALVGHIRGDWHM